MFEKRFKRRLKKHLPEALDAMLKEGMLSIVKCNLIEDKKTVYAIRIKPSWNRPIKKGK